MNKILIGSLLSLASFATQAQVTSNFNASSTLDSKCVIMAQNISFGALNLLATEDVFALGNISALCSKGVIYNIQPEGGHTSTTLSGYRQGMKNTVNNDVAMIALSFQNGSQNWVRWARNGSGGTLASTYENINGTGTGQTVSHPIRAGFNSQWSPNVYFPTSTNVYNYQISPGSYSLNMTTTITY